MSDTSLEKIASLAKRRGFIFPGSEIYGGLANTWDYGPYGSQLKKNVKDFWWHFWVESRDDIVGLDAAILMNPRTWEASGHVANFSDPLVDCRACKKRHRGDKLLEEKLEVGEVAAIPFEEISARMTSEEIACPDCGAVDWADAKKFNLMFRTSQGVTEESEREIYLRPETAQGIFVNFKNVLNATRRRLPFGIAQIGKAFRNEITPGNLTFRTREFEQMEIEYFCRPDEWEKIYPTLESASWEFFKSLGVREENLRWRQHEDNELSHYSSLTKDVEYKFPWGWGELQGLAYRSDYDLRQHAEFSGEKMEYLDTETNEKFIPHCIEPSFGCDRTVLTVLLDAYTEEKVGEDTRVVMKFSPSLAPVEVAILPLSKKEKLTAKAREILENLRGEFRVEYDETQSIGKRYRRQDEIGTPACVTVDFGTIGEDENQSAENHVTVRDRDSMETTEVAIESLAEFLRGRLGRG